MRVDLLPLLRDRSVAHPSRVIGAALEGRDFRVRLVGWPWWLENADRSRDHAIEFIFGGVGDGVLEPLDFDSEFNEALENFSVIAADTLAWAQPRGSAIYCNAPLPKPLEVYLTVHDFLASHGTFRRAWQYLNCPDSEQLGPFIQITQANSYLLGRFPPAIRDLVCAQLDEQGVSYSDLPIGLEKRGQLLVTIQRSQFFCETAEAEFEG
jgi:hypothetical protein